MQPTIESIAEWTWAYRASRILQVACDLELFTHLSKGPMTTGELASASSAKLDLLEKVLIACTAMGLLIKSGDRYRNSPLSITYLVKDNTLYQGDIINHSAGVWNFWNELPNSIRMVPAAKSADSHHNFILGMHNLTLAGRGQLFLDCIDLSGRKRLFDVGGGPGTYSILACRKYPDLRAIVFDLPETIVIAREVLAREGMTDRIAVREGSWETHDFGQGNDVVLMSNILHGPFSQAKMKLRKAMDSLDPGGLLVVQEFLLNEDKTGPLLPALFNVMVGAYSQPELFELMISAGFVQPRLAGANDNLGSAWITATKPKP
ncbi:MAG: hypothetical protein GX455_00275 [Phycisphaerae bacterium]|nr:hypothetical protein [Phycisphaerae bacterium]